MAVDDVVLAVWTARRMRDGAVECELGVGHTMRRRDAPCLSWFTPREEGAMERFLNSPVTQSSLTARPLLPRRHSPAIIGCPAAHPPGSLLFHSLLHGRHSGFVGAQPFPAVGAMPADVQLMMPGGSKPGT